MGKQVSHTLLDAQRYIPMEENLAISIKIIHAITLRQAVLLLRLCFEDKMNMKQRMHEWIELFTISLFHGKRSEMAHMSIKREWLDQPHNSKFHSHKKEQWTNTETSPGYIVKWKKKKLKMQSCIIVHYLLCEKEGEYGYIHVVAYFSKKNYKKDKLQ